MPLVRRRRIAIGLAVAAVALALGAVVLPGVAARRVVAPRLTRALGARVRIGWLAWNPLGATWTLTRLRVAADRGPSAITVRAVRIEARLWDWVRGYHRLRALRLEAPRVRLRATDAGWQLPLPGAGGGNGSTAPPFLLDGGEVLRAVVRLEPRGAAASVLRLRRLALGAAGATPEVSWGGGWLEGRLDRGGIRAAAGYRQTAVARRLRARLRADRVDVRRVVRLAMPGWRREVSGLLDLRIAYEEAGHGRHARREATGRVAGRDLTVGLGGAAGLHIGSAALDGFTVDLERSRATLGRLRLTSPEVWVRREADGIAVPGILPPAPAAAPAAVPWSVTTEEATVEGGRVHWAEPDHEPIDVAIERATLGPVGEPGAPMPVALTAALAGGGRVVATGSVVREPPGVRGEATVEKLALPALVARLGGPLRLVAGEADARLALTLAGHGVSGSGEVVLADLKSASPDPRWPEEVMAARRIAIRIRQAASDPPTADVETIDIDSPYVLVHRHDAGVFPLTHAAAAPAGDTAPARPPPSVHVDRIVVHGGRLDFHDTTLAPAYWTSVASLEATAEDVAVPPARLGRVAGGGLIDEISPLRVEGTVGERTRLEADVQRVALPSLNPYVEAGTSYTVSSGVVSTHTTLVLDRSQLDVTNRIVLSRLGVGGSGEADFFRRELGVPLTLALALMKDYRGNIELALPFGGDPRAPTFSLRGLVLSALVKAVRGAIMSPLNVLGRVFLRDGRIENFDLEPVPFAAGRSDLGPPGRERVVQIARVLGTHPNLALDVRGQVAEADVGVLADEAALAALASRPRAAPLEAFLHARLAGGPLPPLSADQQTQLETLLPSLPWPGDRLRELAVQRGGATVAAFITEAGADPERVSAVTPPAPAPGALAAAPVATLALRVR